PVWIMYYAYTVYGVWYSQKALDSLDAEYPQTRAQRIELTDAGRDAVDRVRDAGARGMQLALGAWKPEELRQLAVLFHRMVDDFLAYAVEDEPGQESGETVRPATM
ncbi:hypothetical protein ABZ372_16795, partial [Streptomyces sp. NPDC005921]